VGRPRCFFFVHIPPNVHVWVLSKVADRTVILERLRSFEQSYQTIEAHTPRCIERISHGADFDGPFAMLNDNI
jgi:hypothetical protein